MFIVRQVQEKQFAVLDDSNVVFQIVLIVFIGLCQLAANGIAKRASQNAEENNFSDAESLKLEKKLYSYKKKYEACFSPRFKEDLCLQALFMHLHFQKIPIVQDGEGKLKGYSFLRV